MRRATMPRALMVTGLLILLATSSLPLASAQDVSSATGHAPGSLGAMLGRLPAVPLGQESLPLTYADLAAQLGVAGVAVPTDPDDKPGWQQVWSALDGVPLPQSLGLIHVSTWRETFGFDLTQIDQAVGLVRDGGDQPPIEITLLRGRFDPDELRAAWTRNGYDQVDAGGATIFSRGPEYGIDWEDEGFAFVFKALDNAALLSDGTLVFAPTLDQVEQVVDVQEGAAAALTDQPEVAALMDAARPDLAAAVLVAGSMLRLDPAAALMGAASSSDLDPDQVATAVASAVAAAEVLPPVLSALIGTTAGGPLPQPGADADAVVAAPLSAGQPAQGEIVVVFASPEDAQAAAPIIAERLAQWSTLDGRPYAQLFPEQAVHAVPASPVVVVELGLGPGVPRGAVQDVLSFVEPGFLVWS